MWDISEGGPRPTVTAADTGGGGGLASKLGGLMGNANPMAAGLNAAAGLVGAVGQAVAAPPAGPSNASGGQLGGSTFDSSGWNLTFGSNSGIDSKFNKSDSESLGGPAAAAMGNYLPYVLMAVGGVVLWKIVKKS